MIFFRFAIIYKSLKMKCSLSKLSLLGIISLCLFTKLAFSQAENPYKLGQIVEDFNMFDFNSKRYSSKSVEKQIIVLFFIGNTCDKTDLITKQMKALYSKYNAEVEFWAVNSNHPNFSPDDSEEKMAEYSKKNELPYPYLVDLGQLIAADYSVKQYPMAVILKKEAKGFKFVYRGIILENTQAGTQNIIERNIKNLLAGKPAVTSPAMQKLCDIL